MTNPQIEALRLLTEKTKADLKAAEQLFIDSQSEPRHLPHFLIKQAI